MADKLRRACEMHEAMLTVPAGELGALGARSARIRRRPLVAMGPSFSEGVHEHLRLAADPGRVPLAAYALLYRE